MSSPQVPPIQVAELSGVQWWWKERDGSDELTRELIKDRIVDYPAVGATVATRETIKMNWFKATRFPSEVHVELLERKVIPHPYIGFNEHYVQWVGETEWLYTCTFDAPQARDALANRLTFDGLDTLCDVYLNGNKILETDNAFRQYVYHISNEQPLEVKNNVLLLHFRCAKTYAKEQEAVHGKVRAGSTNLGDPSRVYLRKPQYDWRWDWGPELMTCGPYRNITLTTYAIRLDNFNPQASLKYHNTDPKFYLSLLLDLELQVAPNVFAGKTHPFLNFEIAIINAKSGVSLLSSEAGYDGPLDGSLPLNVSLPSFADLQEQGFEPWWPVGYGKQNLYTIQVKLVGPGGVVIDSVSKNVGFRSVELVQEPLEEPDQYGTGTTFFFKVNGVETFMGGSNWIPVDNFLTTISDDRYRKWLTLLRDGGQNMVRIWGGGIYEPDVFYEICDELGILVWQDFQFACGVYPAHKSFVDSVRQEAEYNVKRLRHHPSIALFCGNNEDYQMVHQWGDVAQLPAIVIYEHVLPEVVTALTSDSIPYHRGSPYGGKGWDTSDPTVGDVHQWNVWGGKELPWQEYGKLGGRFVSEFGIPAMPSMETIEYWMQGIVDRREWYAQSKIMAQHTRAGAFERRFAITMNENFRLTSDLEKYVFNTQVMQAEAVGLAYRAWKREWKREGKRYCGGVLVWQFNDCWPVTSWALVDYFLRPKPVFYVIARSLAPITVNVTREVVQNRNNDRPAQFYEYGATRSTSAKLHIWATCSPGLHTQTPTKVNLDIQYFDLENPEWHHTYLSERALDLELNGSTELGVFECPEPPVSSSALEYSQPGTTTSGRVVASARLVDSESGEVLARFVDWPQPYRLLDIPSESDVGLSLDLKEDTEEEGWSMVRVSVKRPVKCLFLAVEGTGGGGDFEEGQWSDNALDVVPLDDHALRVYGLKGRGASAIRAQFLKN